MQNNLENLIIFWDESSAYVFAYAVYAFLVCSAVMVLDSRPRRNPASSIYRLGLVNALLAILAVMLFTASLLATGWYANYLGGEISSFILTLSVSSLSLYFSRLFFIDNSALNYSSRRLAGISLSAILVAPYTLFCIFIFLLGSAMRI